MKKLQKHIILVYSILNFLFVLSILNGMMVHLPEIIFYMTGIYIPSIIIVCLTRYMFIKKDWDSSKIATLLINLILLIAAFENLQKALKVK
jgi:hypothetical protein